LQAPPHFGGRFSLTLGCNFNGVDLDGIGAAIHLKFPGLASQASKGSALGDVLIVGYGTAQLLNVGLGADAKASQASK
jgi:hypothetical protein